MKTTIDNTQAATLNGLGLDPGRLSTLDGLLDALEVPCEGQTLNIYSTCYDGYKWSILYDNAGGYDFRSHHEELIDCIFDLVVDLARKWPRCLSLKNDNE